MSRLSADGPATRVDVVMTLGIVLAALLFAAWSPLRRLVLARPSQEACAALLDRYVEHIAYVVEPNPPPAPSAVAARKELARSVIAREKTKDAFTRCEAELTMSEVDCAMKAPSADTFERCLP